MRNGFRLWKLAEYSVPNDLHGVELISLQLEEAFVDIIISLEIPKTNSLNCHTCENPLEKNGENRKL